MRCPKCSCQDDKVIDSRASREGATIRRRRECIGCGYRFTTYEEVERTGLLVLKRDGRREEFSKEKLLSGLKKACQKRPISPKVIEDLVERIVNEVTDKYEREVPAEVIGKLVMEGLRADRRRGVCALCQCLPAVPGSDRLRARSEEAGGQAMITLAADCLLFELATGERIPYSADMVSVEMAGGTAELFDSEFVHHATKAVFHYFKHELGRQSVTVGEFAAALEKVLRGFAATAQLARQPDC